MDRRPLERAIEIAGGQTALAEKLGVKQGHVWKWLNRSKRGVPAEHVIPIERLTAGRVTRHELRPDVYPPEDPPVPRSRHINLRQQAL